MKTNLLTAAVAATAILGLSGAAMAQAAGPAAQDTTTKMNDTNKMNKDGMSNSGMKSGDSSMGSTTSGANTGPSQKPMTSPAEPKGKESNSEAPKR
jgi:hypothetical protein